MGQPKPPDGWRFDLSYAEKIQLLVNDYKRRFEPWTRPKSIRRKHGFEEILWAVCHTTHLPSDIIMGEDRLGEIMKARHITYYLAKTKGNYSFSEIGRKMNRNHVSVINGVSRVAHHPHLFEPLLSNVLKRLEAA